MVRYSHMNSDQQIIGHERITAVLRRLFSTQTMGHAYLFSGPRHVGKRTVAEAVLKELPKKEVICVERLIDEDGKQAESIGIGQIRDIVRSLSLSLPDQESYRVLLFHDTENITQEAGNALLKSLEEPPKRTVFIFFEHMPGRMLLTLRSRCAHVRFSLVSDTCIRHAVEDDEIVRLSAGRPGRAYMLLIQHALTAMKDSIATIKQGDAKFKKEDGEIAGLILHRQIQEAGMHDDTYHEALVRYDAFERIRMYNEAHVYQPGLVEAFL